MTYEPIAYWRERGERYAAEFRPDAYAEQEAALRDVLAGLAFRTVLELGCGFGRIGELIRQVRPDASYTGVDVSPAQLEAARIRLPGARMVESSMLDYAGGPFDLVIAVEVLMHVPPAGFEAAVHRLAALSRRHIVTVDWTEPIRRPAMAHNFRHDYGVLEAFGRRLVRIPVGLQTIHVVTR